MLNLPWSFTLRINAYISHVREHDFLFFPEIHSCVCVHMCAGVHMQMRTCQSEHSLEPTVFSSRCMCSEIELSSWGLAVSTCTSCSRWFSGLFIEEDGSYKDSPQHLPKIGVKTAYDEAFESKIQIKNLFWGRNYCFVWRKILVGLSDRGRWFVKGARVNGI